jgi:transcriptional regulator with XRE-family HTH domain
MTRLTERIAKNMKAARGRLGLSQQDLAMVAKVSMATVARLETQRTENPRGEEFGRIAAALEMTPDELRGINDTDEPESAPEDGEGTDDELDAELEQRTSDPDVLLAFMARVRDPKKMSRRAKIVILEDLRRLGSNRRQG